MLLKFEDDSFRQRFIEKAAQERPDISHRLQQTRRLPHVLATGMTREQEEWISQNLAGIGRAFADVQFEPFTP